jgi:hypothetical protein
VAALRVPANQRRKEIEIKGPPPARQPAPLLSIGADFAAGEQPLIYSKFAGGVGEEMAYRVAVRPDDLPVLIGRTQSPDSPTRMPKGRRSAVFPIGSGFHNDLT